MEPRRRKGRTGGSASMTPLECRGLWAITFLRPEGCCCVFPTRVSRHPPLYRI
jgi:hypothetical protein